jgi:hypothetical protein
VVDRLSQLPLSKVWLLKYIQGLLKKFFESATDKWWISSATWARELSLYQGACLQRICKRALKLWQLIIACWQPHIEMLIEGWTLKILLRAFEGFAGAKVHAIEGFAVDFWIILHVVDREQIATKATVRSKYGAEGNTSFVFKTVRRRYDVIGSMIRQYSGWRRRRRERGACRITVANQAFNSWGGNLEAAKELAGLITCWTRYG